MTLLYLIGMNVFIRTRLFRDAISFDPDSFLLDYTSAYSVLPGRIHVDGLTIRGRDTAVEWVLTLDRCDFRVSFAALLHRRFHARHVRGDGLTLRARRRVDEVTPSVAALPPVPGFRDPPLTDVGPPEAPLTDENYRLWGVELDDVVAEHVREIWIDATRYAGDITVRGRWVFQPLRALEVGPAVVDLRSVIVSYGLVETWGSELEGSIKLTLHPLDLRQAQGADFIDHATADADARGTLHADRVMNRLAPPADGEGLEATQAVVPVELRLLADHGLIRPGTRIRAEPFDARLRRAALSFRARAEGEVRVEEKDGQDLGVASARVASLSVLTSSTEVARAASLSAVLTSHELHLARLVSEPSGLSFHADLAGAETEALPYWQSLVPAAKGVAVSGHATAEASAQGTVAEAARGQFAGNATVNVERLDVRGRSLGLRGDVTAHVVLQRDEGGFDLSGSSVSARDVHASLERSGATVHLLIPSLVSSTPRCISRGEGLHGDVSLDVPGAEMPDLGGLTSALPLPDGLIVETGTATASLHLDMDLESLAARVRARVTVPNLKVRAWGETLAGELGVVIDARPHGSASDLSGTTLEFTSLATADAADWWVRARLDKALLSTAGGLSFRGLLSANAKDASPLGAFIAKQSPVPRWLIDAIPTHRLQITGDLHAGPSVLEVRSLVAKAEGSSVEFEYARLAQWKEWAMLLEAGPVRAGIRSGDGGTQVVLFNAGPWFEEQTAALRAIASRSR